MKQTEIDCRGLKCPLPIVHLALALKDLEPGAELSIVATDPDFVPDLRAWSELTGNPLLDLVEDGETKRATICKAGAP